MLQPGNLAEKKFNAETHRLVGKVQLQEYGLFFDKYNKDLHEFKKKLTNNCNVRYTPVELDGTPNEDNSLLNLAHSDNKLLSRILASLSSVSQEIFFLVDEAKSFYNVFVFYGEDIDPEMSTATDKIKSASKLFDVLHKVYCFVVRSQQIVKLLLHQVDAIIGKNYYTTSNSSSFPELMDCLGELLVSSLTLDSLLSLPAIQEHWSLYRRSLRNFFHNPRKFNYTLEQLQTLEKHMLEIEQLLLSDNIFKSTIEFCLGETYIAMPIVKNVNISNEFTAYISHLISELEKDEENIFFTQVWLQANALTVFQTNVLGNLDKKVFKRLMEVNKKSSACTLTGNILWYPEQFLIKHMPLMAKQIDDKSVQNHRWNLITTKSQNLYKETQNLCSQACLCIINLERLSNSNMANLDVKGLHKALNFLIEAVKLVKKISETIKWITNLHVDQNRPMSKSVLLTLCRLIEVLKCFQFMFNTNQRPLLYVILLISQHLTYKTLTYIFAIKKSFVQEKSYKKQQLDVLSAVNLCEQAISGPNTNQRILITKLALSSSGLSNDNLSEIRSVINKLELVCYLHSLLNKLCDCSFLYWHHIYLLPVYFSKMLQTKSDPAKYYLLLSALEDCALASKNDKVLKMTEDLFKKDLFTPLNQIVETNLRLQTHLHLQLSPSDPFANYFSLNFSKILPAKLKDSYISIRNEAEHYLSTMFYNLTTVVLHDWQTYGEMRRLAVLQYGLETVEDNLPMQTLEQGLDVLEIMRNINTFVEKYLYNLNDQVFIEESSNNKHLNTINISHIANSIRTHGIGIMNTTVNFTYQFLQKKFYVYSQFMFDEHIKSRLLKDMRYFSEYKNEFNQMYPYERAEKFNVGIRRLGLDPNGQSHLDLFRKLISHIGNAMGYVRLIRSGGRRCLAEGTCFIPDLKKMEIISDLLKEEKLPELTGKASTGFLNDFKNLVDNFEGATEYFQLLVNVFVPVFKNQKQIHLKNFYMIVPPLTINFVEHSLTCKERLNKRNKMEAVFTDDGFAMGLAFIIELLGQENELNSLHWFHSVKHKFVEDRKKVQNQRNTVTNNHDKLQQTLTLSEKRISSFEKEFELLYCNYNSARIFFQT